MRSFSIFLACLCVCTGGACGDSADTGPDTGTMPDGGGAEGGVDGGRGLDAGEDAGELPDADTPDADTPDAGPPVDPVAGAGSVETVADSYMGDGFGFLEGPHWRDDALVFSDLIFGTPSRQTIYALTPPDTLEIVVRPSEGANGNATLSDGTHVTCLQGGRRVARVAGDGTLETLFDRYEGDRLNAPNDLVVRDDGSWYFTDPGYGVDPGDREIDVRGVYYVDADTLTRVWSGTTDQRPNGVVLSPDDGVLYLADTADEVVRAFDVASDGSLSGERTFVGSIPGADGMTVDEAGNVYVAAQPGVRVFAPDGSEWGTIDTGMQPANVGFGGADRRTLYVTARSTLYAVDMPIAGIEGR